MSNKKQPRECDLPEVEGLTYEAMRYHGLLPPMSVKEVERMEADLDAADLAPCDPTEILQQLADADDESDECSTVPIAPVTNINTDAIRNLSRAAREGGTLSSEIESRMEEDKSRHQQQESDANS